MSRFNDAWQNFYATAEEYIDTVWGLEGALNRVPRWRGLDRRDDGLTLAQRTKGITDVLGEKLAITDGYESDGSMPSLQTVSDSDEDDFDEVADRFESSYNFRYEEP